MGACDRTGARATTIYPEQIGPDSPYLLLAHALDNRTTQRSDRCAASVS